MARNHLKHDLVVPSLVRPCEVDRRLRRRPVGQAESMLRECRRGRLPYLGLLRRESACRRELRVGKGRLLGPGARGAALDPGDLAQNAKMVRHDVSGVFSSSDRYLLADSLLAQPWRKGLLGEHTFIPHHDGVGARHAFIIWADFVG